METPARVQVSHNVSFLYFMWRGGGSESVCTFLDIGAVLCEGGGGIKSHETFQDIGAVLRGIWICNDFLLQISINRTA